MFNMIQAICNSIAEIFKNSSTSKEHMSEKQMLDLLKKKSKAIDFAEKIIFLADDSDIGKLKLYKFYRTKFFKYNS